MSTSPRKPKPMHPSIYSAEKAIQRAHKAVHSTRLAYPPTIQSNINSQKHILKLNQLSSIPLQTQHQPAIYKAKTQEMKSTARILSPARSSRGKVTTSSTNTTPNSYAEKRLMHYKLRNLIQPHQNASHYSPFDRLKTPQSSLSTNNKYDKHYDAPSVAAIEAKSPKRIDEKLRMVKFRPHNQHAEEEVDHVKKNIFFKNLSKNIQAPLHFIEREKSRASPHTTSDKLNNHETVHVIKIVNNDLNSLFYQGEVKSISSPQRCIEAISPKRIHRKRYDNDIGINNAATAKNGNGIHHLRSIQPDIDSRKFKIQSQEPYIIIHPSSETHVKQRISPPFIEEETRGTKQHRKKTLGIYKRCEGKPTSKLKRNNRQRKTQPTPLVRMLKGDYRLSYVKEIVTTAKERRGMDYMQ